MSEPKDKKVSLGNVCLSSTGIFRGTESFLQQMRNEAREDTWLGQATQLFLASRAINLKALGKSKNQQEFRLKKEGPRVRGREGGVQGQHPGVQLECCVS